MEVQSQKRYASRKFISVAFKSASLALITLILTANATAQDKTNEYDQMIQSRLGGPTYALISSDGQALMDVVVGSDASRQVRDAAQDLADYLGRITGGDFRVVTGTGTRGIAVGSFKDFPILGLDDLFDPSNPTRLDEHLVQTHGSGVYLIGATDLAAQHAVWTLLHKVGYRQFFPTETWEIIPEKPNLRVMGSSFESPSFYNRRAPRGVSWSDGKHWENWRNRNRITSSFNVSTGHAYGGIIRSNQEAFDNNPQFTCGNSSKFRVSEPGLVELVVEHAVNRIKSNPDILSISMEPSDRGGWCDDPQELEYGTVTDRVVYLANAVAEAINDLGYGEKYVGIYAYNEHSEPPNIDVHPNVIVSIATSFNYTGYTVEESMREWSSRGAIIGVRDYYDTYVRTLGMPRGGSGGNINYLTEKLTSYHNLGARFMNACAADSWPVNGPGFYLSSRILWDISSVERANEILEDFLEKAFGDAKEPMRNFYELVGRGSVIPRTNNDLLARMYSLIKEARALTSEPDILKRLDELALYTRYAELWFAFRDAETESERDIAAQNVFRHAYRMQSRMMSPARYLYVELARSRVFGNIPDSADPGNLRVGRELIDMPPWKSSELFTDEEITGFIINALEKYEKEQLDFDIISFSDDLVPAVLGLDLPEVRTGTFGSGFRGRQTLYTWMEASEPLELDVRGGAITHFQNRGNVRIQLQQSREDSVEVVDFDDSVPPDNETYQVAMVSPNDGLHELVWNDGGDKTYLDWEEGHPMTAHVGLHDRIGLERGYLLYFYVPEGTKVVGGYVNSQELTTIRDGDGNEMTGWKNEEENTGYFAIPVEEGQDGTLWSIRAVRGANALRLLTVPPYLARNEKELLLPREVVFGEEKGNVPAENQDDFPELFDLKQNYPNPFNPSTNITFAIPDQTHVRLDIYNVIGQRVSTLVNEEKTPGRYEVLFDAATMASGVYLYRLQTDTFQKTRQMLLVK